MRGRWIGRYNLFRKRHSPDIRRRSGPTATLTRSGSVMHQEPAPGHALVDELRSSVDRELAEATMLIRQSSYSETRRYSRDIFSSFSFEFTQP